MYAHKQQIDDGYILQPPGDRKLIGEPICHFGDDNYFVKDYRI